ncbi:hypothetical protein MUK42_10632 [Musa troglodytarum]|uniref:Nuclear pore complex protein NUP1-like n=1 Tax=Musa troglodytarum TaxID=320322 RepID=A0A9E7GY67_9LILI|nr:hypothetical protein MUK42_10632 [Musa troglodytarum]
MHTETRYEYKYTYHGEDVNLKRLFFPPLSSARFPPSFYRNKTPKTSTFSPYFASIARRRPHLLCRGSIAILLMETPGYEGGIGGKLRRPPLRRLAATPYDRPPTAARGLVVQPSEPGGNGWLAKLVDPASRLITSSASRLFSSVFRKSLPTPSVDGALGEECFQSGQEGDEAASVELPAELQENKADCENNATNNSESNKVKEFEQLIKQKTFTRKVFFFLMLLIYLKYDFFTIGYASKTIISRDQFEHLTGILHSRTLDSDLPKPDKKLDEMTIPLPAKDIESSRPHEDITSPANVQAIDDQAASPVELAKAYMGSKFPNVSPSSLSWQRRHIFQEHKTVPCNSTHATKPFDLKGPRSVRFSGSAEIPDSVTPSSRDISAMYGMSCSPYYTGEGSSKRANAGLLPSKTPETTRQLGGRQVLKRRSSVLDNDFGSYGSIRRIRQKVATMTPSKKVRHPFLSGNHCFVPSTPFKKDVQDDSSLNQEPNFLDQQKRGNRISDSAVASVLPQSNQIENKIFQQLDKLVPLSKEKSPKIKDYPLDGSPANKHAFSKGISNSSFYKQEGVNALGENGPSTSISGVKSVSEADTMQKPAIKMSAPEDTQVNNMDASMDPSCQLKNGNEVKMSPEKPVRSSVIRTEGFPPRTSASIASSSSDFSKAADVKPLNDTVVNNGKGFTFPFASAPGISQPPSTPIIATPLVEKTVAQRGESVFPLFAFGSGDSSRLEFSSATTTGSSNATSGLENSKSNATTSALKGSKSDKGEGQITGNPSRSVGVVDSSDKSTMNNSIVFSFGNSCKESFPNGSLSSSSTSASVMTLPGRTASMIFSTTAPALASSSSSSSSSVAQIFSTVPSLLFGSTTSMVSTTSVPQSLAESNATNLEGSPLSLNCASTGTTAIFKFGGNSSTTLTADYQFSRADTNSVLAASTVPSISSTVSAASTLFSGSNSNQFAVAPTSTFTGASNSNQSAVVPTSTLSSASNSSQSVVAPTLTFSGASNSSQSAVDPTSTFSGASNSNCNLFLAQSNSLVSSVVDNSTKTSGSATGFIGTQTTQAKSGTSPFSMSSGSQFGSYSSPTFGMDVSSSFSPSSSHFGEATTSSKLFSSSSMFSFSGGAGFPSLGASSSFASAASSSVFGSTFQPSTTPAFGTVGSSPFSALAFGVPTSGSTPFVFGSSSPPGFSFSSAGANNSSSISSAHAAFDSRNSAVGFGPGTPGNDEMNVKDSMAEDPNLSAVGAIPPFGQPGTSSSLPVFGAPATQSASSVFQFGSQQNSSLPPGPSPFQAAGGQEFPQGGSFSLGTGGGDKSGRRIYNPDCCNPFGRGFVQSVLAMPFAGLIHYRLLQVFVESKIMYHDEHLNYCNNTILQAEHMESNFVFESS